MVATTQIEMVTPDFDLSGEHLVVTVWLVKRGDGVVRGEPLVEITANDVSIDVSAPASGTLCQRCVEEDSVVAVGDVLARIEVEEE